MERETKKQMSAGVVLSYSTIIAQFLTGLLYTPIVLKSLGQSQYGVYSLCVSFMGYLTIMNAGTNAAYIRFYVQTKVKDKNAVPSLNGVFLKIYTILAFISLTGGWIVGIFSPQIFGSKISPGEYELVKDCFKYLSIGSAGTVLNCAYSSIVTANEKFIFGNALNLITAIAAPVLTIPFLLKGYNCVIIVFIKMIISIATLLINGFFCIRILKVSFDLKRRDEIVLKDIIQFSGFIVLQSIMDQFNWQIDKFILARVQGTTQISVYSVGSTFNTYYIAFAGALSTVFIAQINKLEAKKEEDKLNNLFIQSGRLFAFLIWLFMSAFVIFGYPFIQRWAGLEYKESYVVGLLLMAPVTISLTLGLGQDIARAKNKHQLQIVLNFFLYLLNAFISIPLAIKWGAIGSALGTFIAQMITCGIIQPIYYSKVLGLDMRRFGKQMLPIVRGMVIPATFAIVIFSLRLIKANYISIVIYGIFYLIVYGLSMWFIAMNDYEKSIVNRIIQKVKGRLIKQ